MSSKNPTNFSGGSVKQTVKTMEIGLKGYDILLILPANRTKIYKKTKLGYMTIDYKLKSLIKANFVKKRGKIFEVTSLSKSLFFHVNQFNNKKDKLNE